MPKVKINEQMITDLAKYIRSGTYNFVAAENVGIDESTYYRWLRMAEKAKSGIFHQLSQAIKKARADAETERVAKIREYGMGERVCKRTTITRRNGDVEVIEDYGHGDWQALAWHLERQYPDRWGKREQVAITDGEGQPLQPFVVVLPNNEPMLYPRGNGHSPDEVKLLNIGKSPPNASDN